MSYLNIPRLHFCGKFQADPSTVNNNNANYDPAAVLSEVPADPNNPDNTSVYWNPNGTHNFRFKDCTVRGVANDEGQFNSPSSDPLVGAEVLSVFDKVYTAKLVDLDPDNQGVSQIFGVQVRIRIPDPTDATKDLASVTGEMPPTAFADLWNRAVVANPANIGMPTMSASFQSVLQNVKWVNADASKLLAALKKRSPDTLSIRFNVDSYQPDMDEGNFTFGRVVGTIGPVLAGDPPRFVARRMAPVTFLPMVPPPSIFSTYGAVGVAWDDARSRLILDLGNCVPTQGSQSASPDSVVPVDGWPINTTDLQLSIPGTQKANLAVRLKSGAHVALSASLGEAITFSLETYLTYAGIVEVKVDKDQVSQMLSQPLTLTDITDPKSPTVAVQEDSQGRYADVSLAFFRMNPGETTPVKIWATKFGQPWANAQLDVSIAPAGPASNGPQPPLTAIWQNGTQPGLGLTVGASQVIGPAATLTTGSDGTATLTLNAQDPGTPRVYANGDHGPDGQVYLVSGSWASWGKIFLFSGAPINVLVFSGYPIPDKPTWTEHISPIFSYFAKVYPYMKTILDLSDYATVIDPDNAPAILNVLKRPVSDPHHMPVVRDLSAAKLATVLKWYANGTPK